MPTPLDIAELDTGPEQQELIQEEPHAETAQETPTGDHDNEGAAGTENVGEEPSQELPTEQQESRTDDTVPLATFLETKGRLKAEKEQHDREMQEMRSQLGQMQAFRDEYLRRQQTQETPQPERTDYYDDPEKHTNERFQEQEERLRQQQARLDQADQHRAQQEAIAQFAQQVSGMAETFKERQPDYLDARQAVRDLKAKELQSYGFTDPQQINAQIDNWEMQFAYQTIQQKKNPAEQLYELAKNIGYTRNVPEVDTSKVENIEKAQKENRNLGTGGASDVETDLQDMEDDEFQNAMDSYFNSIR